MHTIVIDIEMLIWSNRAFAFLLNAVSRLRKMHKGFGVSITPHDGANHATIVCTMESFSSVVDTLYYFKNCTDQIFYNNVNCTLNLTVSTEITK